jgi:hypothetical protein
MSVRIRKLIGTVLLIILVIVYAWLATTVAVARLGESGPDRPPALFPADRLALDPAGNVGHQVDGERAQTAGLTPLRLDRHQRLAPIGHCCGDARHHRAHMAHLLVAAIDRNSRQCVQMIAVLGTQHAVTRCDGAVKTCFCGQDPPRAGPTALA